MVTTVFETNLSLQDARLNTVMKKLTAWAAIIAVPTAVTGYFGQNLLYPDSTHNGDSCCPPRSSSSSPAGCICNSAARSGCDPPRYLTSIAALPARPQLADHRRARDLTRDQQAPAGLRVGEQQALARRWQATAPRACGSTQSRLRRVPPLT